MYSGKERINGIVMLILLWISFFGIGMFAICGNSIYIMIACTCLVICLIDAYVMYHKETNRIQKMIDKEDTDETI